MRRTPLKRTTPLARAKRLSPRSAKREAEAAERFIVRERVFARDGHCCVVPLLAVNAGLGQVMVGACYGPLTYHHLKKASAGGPYTVDNGATACAFHNGWIEDRPHLARSLGLVR